MTQGSETKQPAALLRAAALLLPLLFTFVSAPSFAAGQFGIGVFGTYNSYAMDDLNDEFITPLNELLEAGGSSARMDKIENGLGFGGGLRYQMPKLLVAVDYERLMASTDVSEAGESFDLDMPATAVTATLSYLLSSTSNLHFQLGAGIGYYTADGEASFDDGVNPPEESEFKGNGIGYHVGGGLDVGMTDQVHLNLFAGWRQAKTTDLEVDGEKILLENGDDATLDWSGVMAKVGLNFMFGMTGAE